MPIAPRPPRAPNAPVSPRAPQAPRPPARPRLTQWRDRQSAGLDGRTVKPRGEDEQPIPEYVRWPQFRAFLDDHWEAGEHMAIVTMTGGGKTTLMREIIGIRGYTVIVANKQLDDSLYPPMHPTLKKLGFVVANGEFDPRNIEHPRVIFYCPLTSSAAGAQEAQREKIRQLLVDLYVVPGWTIVIDEVSYLSRDLKLDTELNALWREGRSKGTTMVAGTQRPVNVPRNMWEMSTHFAIFKISGKEDRDTATGYLGDFQGVGNETVRQLPRHEFLYVDKVESIAMRSRVELGK